MTDVRPFIPHDLPKSRPDALACGAPTFFTGQPCKYGHVSPRRTLNSVCVDCDRAHAGEQKKTPEWQEYRRLWLARNPEKRAEYKRTSKARMRERLAPEKAAKQAARIAWREATAAERLAAQKERGRQYRIVNREKVNATIKAARLKRPEHYKKMHRPHSLINAAKNRARKAGDDGSFSRAHIEFLLAKQNGKCAHSWCRKSIKKERHIDHIMPLVLGGPNDKKNLQLLCVFCNLSKGGKHPIDVAQHHGRLL